MKILHLLVLSFLSVGLSSHTFAEDRDHHEHHHDDEKVDHYEGKNLSSPKEALESLNADNKKIASILKSDALTDAQLEQIHQISYGLEDAVDLLIKEKASDAAQLGSVDEAIQAVHYASENHEETKVRKWFAKLKSAVGNIDINA